MSEISPVSETELLSKVPPVVLEFKNGIRIKVPDSINMITPYVIHEQGKWFEKEMQFLDAFLKPGMQAIDIGANYGVYTLSIARILGPEGRLWAFEPATSTKAYLGSSLAENNFENVELIQAALSNVSGTAKLSLNVNSELNEITDSPTSDYEEIPLLTLDKCRQDLNWESIDFIKIDAEGQEENILQGGRRLLDECSPLIMFEFKHKNKVNLSLIERFSNINYQTYRYVEGLGFLVPFKIDELPDPYELNLFGCKKDMARRLEEDGLLISTETLEQSPDLAPRENWQNYYTTMPYYKRLYGDREFTGAFTLETDRDVYVKALEQFSVAQSPEQTPIKRFLAV